MLIITNTYKQHTPWLFIAVISVRQTSEKQPTYKPVIFGKAADYNKKTDMKFIILVSNLKEISPSVFS
jgi:hypothetical protein